MSDSVERLEAVRKLVEGVKESYPDAKKLKIDVDFQIREDSDKMAYEVVPVVYVEVER